MPSAWRFVPECNYIGVFKTGSSIIHFGFPFTEWSLCGNQWFGKSFVDEIIYYQSYADLTRLLIKMRNDNDRMCLDCYRITRQLEEAAEKSKEAIYEHAANWYGSREDAERFLVRPESDNDGRGSYRLREEDFVAFNRVRDSETYRFGYFAKAKRG